MCPAGPAEAATLAQGCRHHKTALGTLVAPHVRHAPLLQDRRPASCAAGPRPQAYRHNRDLRQSGGQGFEEGSRETLFLMFRRIAIIRSWAKPELRPRPQEDTLVRSVPVAAAGGEVDFVSPRNGLRNRFFLLYPRTQRGDQPWQDSQFLVSMPATF